VALRHLLEWACDACGKTAQTTREVSDPHFKVDASCFPNGWRTVDLSAGVASERPQLKVYCGAECNKAGFDAFEAGVIESAKRDARARWFGKK